MRFSSAASTSRDTAERLTTSQTRRVGRSIEPGTKALRPAVPRKADFVTYIYTWTDTHNYVLNDDTRARLAIG